MARIPLFDARTMSEAQAEVYEAVVRGPRGRLVGPLRAAMHNPVLADRWQRLGEVLRYDTVLPKRLSELAILVTARRWNGQLEWHIHADDAAKAGLQSTVIEAIAAGEAPVFEDPESWDIYTFTRQMQLHGDVQEDVYERIHQRWGTVGVVELSSVIGYYTLVAMTLNVHRIPLPDEVNSPLHVVTDTQCGLPRLTEPAPAVLQAGAHPAMGER
ncbi:carboxymuconolactone decarboxylase family protein [Pseudomonas putida]|uniref:carboxymuconolactone decarboxylase family protein n=1 Tax=Pseudomonas putida TaxID=303 RepID=UPI00226DE84A|nr:carboxymuconolactone decarboxylase family protein [Pseudomonas putida]WAB95974.1 carboxymuconolactone decarboxylase family protein [Pseudomonas putida]